MRAGRWSGRSAGGDDGRVPARGRTAVCYQEAMTPDELRSFALFAGVGDEGLARMCRTCTDMEASAGTVLALAGDAGSGMFVILEGRVEVELRTGAVELGPGDFFGELALFVPEERRVARVRATTDVRCVSIPREELLPLLEAEPKLAIAMLEGLARRLIAVQHPG